MGDFLLQVGKRKLVLANRLHREGAEWLWKRAFLADATIEAWLIGITSWNIPDDPKRRPDHTSDGTGGFGFDEDTTYAEVAASVGGAWSADHLALMELANEQEVTFTASGGIALSSLAEFENEIPWTPYRVGTCGGWMVDGVYIPDRSTGADVAMAGSYPIAGWPWSTPLLWPGEWKKSFSGQGMAEYIDGTHWKIVNTTTVPAGTYDGFRVYITDKNTCTRYGPYELDTMDGNNPVILGDLYAITGMVEYSSYYFSVREENTTLEAIEERPALGASFPISAAYLAASDGETKKLIASCVFSADTVLFNASSALTLGYRAKVREWVLGVDS